jgi:hypothetical protein
MLCQSLICGWLVVERQRAPRMAEQVAYMRDRQAQESKGDPE